MQCARGARTPLVSDRSHPLQCSMKFSCCSRHQLTSACNQTRHCFQAPHDLSASTDRTPCGIGDSKSPPPTLWSASATFPSLSCIIYSRLFGRVLIFQSGTIISSDSRKSIERTTGRPATARHVLDLRRLHFGESSVRTRLLCLWCSGGQCGTMVLSQMHLHQHPSGPGVCCVPHKA